MLNYLRYFVVLILLGSLSYTYLISIKQATFKSMIDKKLPILIKKKALIISINNIEIIDVSNNILESNVKTTVKMNELNKIGNFLSKVLKKDNSVKLNFLTQTKPKVNGSFISFELLSLKVNTFIHIKKVKGFLKEKIESIKIPIKKLEKISWLISVKSFHFDDTEDLNIELGLSKLIIFLLIPLFLLREIGLLLIYIYQKVLSPKKGYKCAKGELYQNGTCSSTTKEVFKNHGFIAGMREYRNSTKKCKKAYKTMKEKENKRDCTSCDPCPSPSCGSADIGCGSLSCDIGSC